MQVGHCTLTVSPAAKASQKQQLRVKDYVFEEWERESVQQQQNVRLLPFCPQHKTTTITTVPHIYMHAFGKRKNYFSEIFTPKKIKCTQLCLTKLTKY